MKSTHLLRGSRAASLALVSFAGAACAYAQQDQGAVVGTVTDISGAVLPNATVTLTNTDQGLVLTAKTDGKVTYVFPPIMIGAYRGRADSPGSRKSRRSTSPSMCSSA